MLNNTTNNKICVDLLNLCHLCAKNYEQMKIGGPRKGEKTYRKNDT